MDNHDNSKQDAKNKDIKITAFSYDKDSVMENSVIDPAFLQAGRDDLIHWIDIGSLEDPRLIEDVCKNMGLHHLMIEDILDTKQAAKLDNYDDCLFLVLKMLRYDTKNQSIKSEHVSIVVKENYLVSFHEHGEDIFLRVKEKIRKDRDNIRKLGTGYLCYELIDTIADNYFSIIEHMGDAIDKIEEKLLSNPTKRTLHRIYLVKRELMYLRKSVFPLRELVGELTRCGSVLKSENTDIYFRDIYDHLIQIVDMIETYQDIMSNMLDTYLSSIGNKTNDTMKVLTIFSTIFIPLTFLAGVYGMNFKNIPELGFKYGYLFFWAISVVITLVMLYFFHKKKWL